MSLINTYRYGELRIDHVETSGVFELDGGCWDVDNNIWLVGNEKEVLVIEAAHDAEAIIAAVDGRNVTGILCSHSHNDHITVAPELAAELDAPIYAHPGDDMLWVETHPEFGHLNMEDGDVFTIAGTDLKVINTPGHSPGSCCFYMPETDTLFSGDTLFNGGPGATGRSHSHFPTIIQSIQEKVLTLPEHTTVRTGHGDHTTVGREAPFLQEWIKRGH